jgi:hypothetical protein
LRNAVRRDFDNEVVERVACVLAGDLEDEVPTRAGLQAWALIRRKHLGSEGHSPRLYSYVRWTDSVCSVTDPALAQVGNGNGTVFPCVVPGA